MTKTCVAENVQILNVVLIECTAEGTAVLIHVLCCVGSLSCTLELFDCMGLAVGVNLSVCTVGDNVQFLVERGVLCSAASLDFAFVRLFGVR
jgi:hypothetical protein